jgi:hypothetical protein
MPVDGIRDALLLDRVEQRFQDGGLVLVAKSRKIATEKRDRILGDQRGADRIVQRSGPGCDAGKLRNQSPGRMT